MISLVYAQDQAGAIGYQNDLPWKLPADLQFFKKTTMGHTMVMGRRTFESMGKRLLPGRQTVVVTRQTDYGQAIKGLAVVHSIPELLDRYGDRHLMVIGGADLFKAVLPYTDEIIRTFIFDQFPADTFMDPIDTNRFECVKVATGQVDADNRYPHQFEWWHRKEDTSR